MQLNGETTPLETDHGRRKNPLLPLVHLHHYITCLTYESEAENFTGYITIPRHLAQILATNLLLELRSANEV
jgi:hypothetical protein